MWTGTLSLNQCNGIISKIKSLLWLSNSNRSKSVPDQTVKVNMGDVFLNKAGLLRSTREQLAKLKTQIGLQETLYHTLYTLRSTVVEKNCECGVNRILSQLSYLTDVKGLYKTIGESRSDYKEYVDRDFLNLLEGNESVPEVDSLFSTTREIALFSVAEITDKVQWLEAQISKLEIQRDKLNNETQVQIEISEDIANLVGLVTA